MAKRIKWCLVGTPDHEGVMNVGGRVGAAGGPAAFRRVFARFRGTDGVHESLGRDVNCAPLSRSLEQNHRAAADRLRDLHAEFPLSVVVGGGNDYSYPQLLGVAEAFAGGSRKKLRLGCINIDPHFDVREARPLITSGSPFRLALDSGLLDPARFVEFGIQRHCNAPELWDYIRRKKVNVVPFESLRGGRASAVFARTLKRLAARCDVVVVSLDLDAVAQAYAPGVSAPQAEGFTPTDVLEMMVVAARERKVRSLGIFELNPAHDLDDRTARVAATAAYHFVAEALPRR
jgi:formimidoylglutamase